MRSSYKTIGLWVILIILFVATSIVAGYIAMQPGTIQMMRLYAAWFRCFLADDQVACKLFEGGAPNNCGLCKDPGWHVLSSKKL